MKLNMGHIVKGLIGLAICSAIMIIHSKPAQAILEGSNREKMEYLDFSENIIKDSLYARTGKSTFNRERKTYVRGIKRHNEPKIYQPDVYTWELAMSEHRKKLGAMTPPQEPSISNLAPIPMSQGGILPADPGMPQGYDPKAEFIKRQVAEQMNSLNPKGALNIPALQPAMEYPRGSKGDSCDASF